VLARRGSRPVILKQTEYEWAYLFGAVCPETGDAHACILPLANTETMSLYLADFARHLAKDVHALLVMDQAGWHTTGQLRLPANVSLLSLPPYSPELNPAELLWRELRQKYLANRVFPTVAALDEAVGEAWRRLIASPESLQSLTGFPYILSALTNRN
jgi:transposase